jgi:hypothetical protein
MSVMKTAWCSFCQIAVQKPLSLVSRVTFLSLPLSRLPVFNRSFRLAALRPEWPAEVFCWWACVNGSKCLYVRPLCSSAPPPAHFLPPLSFSLAVWCPKAFTFVTPGLGSVYSPFNSGRAGILCLTCFEMKIASALLKWFPMSSNMQQPGWTDFALLKQATKEQRCVPLGFLTWAVSCRGSRYSIESDCLYIAKHKWCPFKCRKTTGGQLGIHRGHWLKAQSVNLAELAWQGPFQDKVLNEGCVLDVVWSALGFHRDTHRRVVRHSRYWAPWA